MNCKVLIADDHGVVRKGLRLLLEQYSELEVIGEAANGREAVTLAATLSLSLIHICLTSKTMAVRSRCT